MRAHFDLMHISGCDSCSSQCPILGHELSWPTTCSVDLSNKTYLVRSMSSPDQLLKKTGEQNEQAGVSAVKQFSSGKQWSDECCQRGEDVHDTLNHQPVPYLQYQTTSSVLRCASCCCHLALCRKRASSCRSSASFLPLLSCPQYWLNPQCSFVCPWQKFVCLH